MLQKIKIGLRLALTFGVLVLLLLSVATFALVRLHSADTITSRLVDEQLMRLGATQDLANDANNLEATFNSSVLASGQKVDKAKLESLAKKVIQNGENFNSRINQLATKVSHVENLRVAQRDFFVSVKTISGFIATDDIAEAMNELLGKFEDTKQTYLQSLVQFRTAENQVAIELRDDLIQANARATRSMIVIVVLAILIAVVLGVLVTRSITRPLASAIHAAQDIAQGNLTAEFSVSGNDEVAHLSGALTDMMHRLAHMVMEIRANADSLKAASEALAQGHSALARRSEQQAATLEETASSIEVLGETINRNTHRAQDARSLTIAASDIATKGNEATVKVTHTMDAIKSSANEVAEIVSVIDSISFQTNLLALNAAVEAARAGEQGRGFAVVASEVRLLAQRSADAAKEIKTLINAAVSSVEAGSALVDEAGVTIQKNLYSSRKVVEIMAEIAQSTAEQNEEIGQVNGAVAEIDAALQQNNQLVKEATDMAMGLQDQASFLVALVSRFQITGDHQRAVPKPPVVATLVAHSRSISKPRESQLRPFEANAPSPIYTKKATDAGEWAEF